MDYKHKYNNALFACSLFVIHDILRLVFGFLHNLQLEYWMTQSNLESEIETLVHNMNTLGPNTLLHLMKMQFSSVLIAKADVKTTRPCIMDHENKWPCLPLRNLLTNGEADRTYFEHMNSTVRCWSPFLVHAPMWWVHQNATNIPPMHVYNHINNFDQARLRELHIALDFTSWSKCNQESLFVNACYIYSDNVPLIAWLWNILSLVEVKMKFKFSRLSYDVLVFVLNHTTCDWGFDPVFLRSASHVELLKTRWPDQMPTAVDALSCDDNLDIAIAMWNIKNGQCLSYFDSLLPDTRLTRHSMMLSPLFNTPAQKPHCPIVFDDSVASLSCSHQPHHHRFNGSHEPSLTQHPKCCEYLDVLIRNVCSQPNVQSSLHCDTRAWLDNCLRDNCRDAYFWTACAERVESMVVFMWEHVDDATQMVWFHALPLCLPFKNAHTLRTMHPQIKRIITDHIDLLMYNALTRDNFAFWDFGLSQLTPREVYRACQLSMECNSKFYIAAWSYVDPRHANILFDLALARRHRSVAMFLLKQPELQLEHLGDRLPVFVDMTLYDAIIRVPFFKHFSEAQMLWCAQRALEKGDAKTLDALYPLLPLTNKQWQQLLISHDLATFDLEFIEALLRCELVTGPELFARNQTQFLSVLHLVHFDV